KGSYARFPADCWRESGRLGCIQQCENAFGCRHCCLQDIELFGEILQRLEETTHELEKRRYCTYGNRTNFHPTRRRHQQACQCKCGEKLDNREIQRIHANGTQVGFEVTVVEGIEAAKLSAFATKQLHYAHAREALGK